MTKQAYIKYREMLQNGKVRKIWEMPIPQQTKYDRWSAKIIEMKMKCERRQSKGKESKKITDLRKIKKKIRTNLGVQTEESERSVQRQRLQMLTRHIEEETLELDDDMTSSEKTTWVSLFFNKPTNFFGKYRSVLIEFQVYI